jgi:hypothetical protein
LQPGVPRKAIPELAELPISRISVDFTHFRDADSLEQLLKMAAMMPSSGGGGGGYGNYDNDAIERDLIDPDDGMAAFSFSTRLFIPIPGFRRC